MINTFRKQYSIDVILSTPEKLPKAFVTSFLMDISTSCGGCTHIQSTGYWCGQVGIAQQDTYDKLFKENNLHVNMTVEADKFDAAYADIQAVCSAAKLVMPNIQWIHCVVKESLGAHFKV